MPEFRFGGYIDGVPSDLKPGDARVGSALVVAPVAPPFTGGVAQAVRNVLFAQVLAVHFGVVADTGEDQGPALRRAIAYAQSRGADLILPEGAINIGPDPADDDAVLRITGRMNMRGCRATRLIPLPSVGTRSIIVIQPQVNAGGIRGMVLRDFQIGDNFVPRNGGHAIKIDTTLLNGFVAKLLIQNLGISAPTLGPGYFAIYHKNDPDKSPTGGLFASTICDNDLLGGTKFEQTGDSNNIERNIISGPNTGIDYAPISGAATARLSGNNITSDGGGIVARGGQQIKIFENQIEQVNDYTGPFANPAAIVIDGTSDWVIRDNNINAYARVDVVSARNNARGGTLGPNTVTYASNHYLYRAVGSPGNTVERQHVENIDGSVLTGRALTSVDASSPTFGVWQQASLSGGWSAATDANFRQGLWFMPLRDGTVRLQGAVTGGTTTPGAAVATLPPIATPNLLAQRIPVLALNSGDWSTGVMILDAAGTVSVQSLLGNTLVQFDGTSFSIRP